MAQRLSPFTELQSLDANGVPHAGYKLFTYLAGTSTKTATTMDKAGAVAHTNPIILNSRGEPANVAGARQAIWQTAGQELKYVLAPPADTDPPVAAIWSIDNVKGINDIDQAALSQWIAGDAPTFVDTTTLTLPGDQTSTYHIGRRVMTTNSGGTIFSTITASVFTSVTTLTLLHDSGNLDAGLSAISYGLLSSTNNSVPGGALYAPTQFQNLVHFIAGLGPNYSQNYKLDVSVAANALTIALKGKDGSNPSTANAAQLTFRSSTLTNGTYVTRSISSALSVVVPSGATLGFTSAETNWVDVYAIDVSGTVELAVASRRAVDEGNVVTTVALSSGADLSNTLYSTTLRSNVPIVRLGRLLIQTGATPGEWSNAPTIVTSAANDQHGMEIFTSSGTFVPKRLGDHLIIALGGGGGGGGGGAGDPDPGMGGFGGSGGQLKQTVASIVSGANITVTVGAGGSGGAGGAGPANSGSAGSAGTDSSFGSYLTASAGAGGRGGVAISLNAGAVSSGPGANGSGNGGGIGGAGVTTAVGQAGTAAGANTGGGGGGGSGSDGNFAGGAGAAGGSGYVVVVW